MVHTQQVQGREILDAARYIRREIHKMDAARYTCEKFMRWIPTTAAHKGIPIPVQTTARYPGYGHRHSANGQPTMN